jgi:hypothetical protein
MFCSCTAATDDGADTVAPTRYTASLTEPCADSRVVTRTLLLELSVVMDTTAGTRSRDEYATDSTRNAVEALYTPPLGLVPLH